MQTKTCTKCGAARPVDAFSRSAKGALGRHAECKACAATRIQEKRRSQKGFPPTVLEKECVVCGTIKSASEFYPNALASDRLQRDCKICRRASVKARYVENPAAVISAARRWQTENPDRKKANAARRRPFLFTDQRKEELKLKLRAEREQLKDWYVKQLIVQHIREIPVSCVPDVLIDTVRVHVKIKRKLKEGA